MRTSKRQKVVFIFRRDLRWNDNIGLTKAFDFVMEDPKKRELYPMFIFNPVQIDPAKNPYYSANSLRFMIECIKCDLMPWTHIMYGADVDALASIKDVSAVFFNRDYTPFARRRDQQIIEWCEERDIHVYGEWNEYSLVDVPNMKKPYRVFGAFYKAHGTGRIPTPLNNESSIKKNLSKSGAWQKVVSVPPNAQAQFKGGRKVALTRLAIIARGALKDYNATRDFPALMLQEPGGTTMMSAYLKYGCVSIRELYQVLKANKSTEIIRQIYWRAYYEQMAYWFPHTLSGQLSGKAGFYNHALNPQNDRRAWVRNTRASDAIMSGRTGIPIVDAAVRQLVTTGFMHNRLRMIVCMLACRILKMDWRIFEKWFATHLIDYYPAVNRMSWEWSTTYRFTLDPWTQQTKFDKDCVFIKHWLPVLADVPPKHIHKWDEYHKNYNIDYPIEPLVIFYKR